MGKQRKLVAGKIFVPVLLILVALPLYGCGNNSRISEPEVSIEEYQRVVYETTEAQRGDITPSLKIKLTAVNYERKSYYPLYDDMEIESVNVAAGDKVKAGDVLISFKSGDIEEQIASYQDKLAQNKLLIEHYQNLMKIDSSVDYSDDIAALNADNQVFGLYIEELNAKLSSYNICAEEDGSVVSVADILDYEKVGTSNNLVTVVYGAGQFEGEAPDDYDFQVGESYTAEYGVALYELTLTDITDGKLIFSAADENTDFSNRDRLTLMVEKETLKDVVYIPSECVFDVGDKYYVYLLDDSGFRDICEVTLNSTVDGYTVIESGLNAGDKVVLK